VPHVALTATATKSTQTHIIQSLGMKDPIVIQANPDRPNIYLEAQRRPRSGNDKLSLILN